MAEPAVSVHGLVKSYGNVPAVRGIDLEIRRGEIFALLGPNGAGKTTTVEILEGYRQRDAGDVSVLGFDPSRQPGAMKSRIGIVLQQTGIDRYLTVGETLQMYAGFYLHPRVRHFALALQAAFLGTKFQWTDVLVVAAWGVGGLLLAVRYFNWEPRTAS